MTAGRDPRGAHSQRCPHGRSPSQGGPCPPVRALASSSPPHRRVRPGRLRRCGRPARRDGERTLRVRRHRGRHRWVRPSGWPSSGTASRSSTPAPTPWPRSTGGPASRASPTGSPATRATCPTCPTSSARSADLVLCHGVLEIVDDPAAALAAIAGGAAPRRPAQPARRPAPRRRASARACRPLRPGARAPRRHPDGRRREGSPPTAARGPPFTADEVRRLLADAGSRSRSVHGIRVFADLVPGSLLDLEPGATEALRRARARGGRASGVPPARDPAARPGRQRR